MTSLIDYFHGDELAANAWKSKYAAPGENTPDDMHRRMAKEFARIEAKYQKVWCVQNMPPPMWNSLSHYGRHREELDEERIYQLFKDFKYIVPQGSIMAMLGHPTKLGSLSNCFVIGQPYDSYGGIFQKDQQMAQLMKRRGGVGIDISTLRPSEVSVSNAAGTSTGAASFMHRYSNTTREVAQRGRRGALMITIDIRHPDVAEFVNMKKDRTAVTGANVSVMLRDDFMKAVEKDEDYMLRWPCNDRIIMLLAYSPNFSYDVLYPIVNDETTLGYVKKVKARELYNQIVENAWDHAEPGQMFVDRHWDYSPDSVYPRYKGVTTNPCGEIFMGPYDACRLFAENLFSIVDEPFTENAHINKERHYSIAYEQQRLADDLIDLELEHIDRIIDKIEKDPEPDEIKAVELDLWKEIRSVCRDSRRTGCGFTALADMFAALNVKYDSDEALEIAEQVFGAKLDAELNCSVDLAIQRGHFEGFDAKREKTQDEQVNSPVQGSNVRASV